MRAFNRKKLPKHTTKGKYRKYGRGYIYSNRYSKRFSYGYFIEDRYDRTFIWEM